MSTADDIATLAEHVGQPLAPWQLQYVETVLEHGFLPHTGRTSITVPMQLLASPRTIARLLGIPLSLLDPTHAHTASRMRSDYRRRQLARKRRRP